MDQSLHAIFNEANTLLDNDMTEKCREIFAHFEESSDACEKLNKFQKQVYPNIEPWISPKFYLMNGIIASRL